jgi:hypothetical protein
LAGTVARVCVPPLKVPAGITLGTSLPGADTVQLTCEMGMVSPLVAVRLDGEVTLSVALAGPLPALLRRYDAPTITWLAGVGQVA